MVPNGWNKQTVGDLCDFINGNGFKSSEWSNKGLPIIRIQNLNGSNNFNYYDGKVLDKWIVNQGDILFAWAGSKGVSFGAKYWNGPKGLLNQHIFRVEPKAHVDKKWLFWVLLKVTQRVENMAHGFKATLLHVQKADITEQVIFVPSLSEQQRIAQILSTWDQAISVTEKLLENSQQQKKALMQQLLTGKKRLLNEDGVRFSGGWKKGKLGDIATIDSGFAFKSSDFIDSSDGVPIIRMSDFKDGGLDISGAAKVSKKVTVDLQRFKLNSGDFVFGMSGSLSNYGWVKQKDLPCYLNQRVGRLVANKNANQIFVTYLYLSDMVKQSILDKAAGAAQLNISVSDLRSTPIFYPSKEEQKEIATVLSIADQEIETLQKKLDSLKLEKKALMQQLLTGKKRVKVAA